MKFMINGFLLPLVLVIIGAILAWWLAIERYDVRFTLSERIPAAFEGGSEEAIQQVNIVNFSKGEVEGVQLVLPGRITKYRIIKNSEADSISEFKNDQKLEIIYNKLPSSGSIRVVFKSIGDGVLESELTVKHAKGFARSALTTTSGFQSVVNAGSWIFIGVYMVLIAMSIRSSSIDYLEKRVSFEADKVLRRSSPFYVGEEKWAEIRNNAVRKLAIADSWHGGLESLFDIRQFKLLCGQKPDYMNVEEWDLFCRQASASITDSIKNRLSWMTQPKGLLPLLNCKRPINYSESSWNELLKDGERMYVDLRNQVSDYQLVEVLKWPPLESIDAREWAKSQDVLQKRYYVEIVDELDGSYNPAEKIKKYELALLSARQQEAIQRKVYLLQLGSIKNLSKVYNAMEFINSPKPKWMDDDDYKSYHEIAALAIAGEKKRDQVDLILEALQSIASGFSVSSLIDRINDPEKAKLVALDSKLRGLSKQLEEDKKMLSDGLIKLNSDRAQVTKQLELLERFLDDPTCVDRVESYNIPFAKGNWDVLLKLSGMMRLHKSSAAGERNSK